jgi:hypothetical protein
MSDHISARLLCILELAGSRADTNSVVSKAFLTNKLLQFAQSKEPLLSNRKQYFNEQLFEVVGT